MDPDPLNLSQPDCRRKSKIAENSTVVLDSLGSTEAITVVTPSEKLVVDDFAPKYEYCISPESERNCLIVAPIMSSVMLSDDSEKCTTGTGPLSATVNPNSTNSAGMNDANILGGNPSHGVELYSESAPKCILPVSTRINNRNPAISKAQIENRRDFDVKPCALCAGDIPGKACEEAAPEETSLSVICDSGLSSNDGLPIIDDSENHPDDSRSQNENPSSQDYGRVGDDVGGGQDREDMSMSHPGNSQQGSQVIPDEAGNLRILVRKTKPLLGIAIEGGANTRHPLPRIININENGAAYDAGGLQVGQLILEVDGHKVEGMHHQEVARLIAESFAQRDKPHIEFLVVEAKKSNLEPKPTALIFLEA